MPLSGSHMFGSIEETRVTFVEKGVSEERKDFLKKLLEHNGFEVIIQEDKKKAEEDPQLFTVAVTNMVFNPTIWVYQRKLKTFDGKKVNQDYWEQRSEDSKPQYWNNGKKL
ncbi:MAG: hypothetical protein GW827_02525 [Flavobacteriales bacterium]|nr:hypothetical protein [Flavobacteriia bacterium]NCP05862.1 hypothetical protein [Flavobacteriales bacterium]PIV93211.1 MAG: hypothetical protein COW44_10680 [Flavobacteriaceae bacterium CG17_big_fil_post_rev_8_21_14_2_50_33_15]PIY12847.1 MAG: hypothetical protein COZ17_02445 [Flavobacteriaceae bacterium CG_4_10_14_3_um_filter_33_47]PJB19992.1 MAG: hypothetical protein CO117_02590 [Flavobacteriaceae bacterium CG_4_9_14_3_um_filter_33_16]